MKLTRTHARTHKYTVSDKYSYYIHVDDQLARIQLYQGLNNASYLGSVDIDKVEDAVGESAHHEDEEREHALWHVQLDKQEEERAAQEVDGARVPPPDHVDQHHV